MFYIRTVCETQDKVEWLNDYNNIIFAFLLSTQSMYFVVLWSFTICLGASIPVSLVVRTLLCSRIHVDEQGICMYCITNLAVY